MAFDTNDWWLVASATEWMTADLAGQMPAGMHIPKSGLPTALADLKSYVPLKVIGFLDLLESVRIADGALNNGVAELAAQHLAAASTIIQPPSDDILNTIRKDLETVNTQLKDVERFKAVANLAGALANIVTNRE